MMVEKCKIVMGSLHLSSAVQRRYCTDEYERGFTLVELIVVMIVAGILMATVLPRFSGRHGFEERGFRDETVTALRYAQKAAVASRRLVCVTFTASGLAARIAIAPGAANCNAGVGVDLIGPLGVALAVSSTGGATYVGTPAMLTFNPLGQPSTGVVITVTDLAGVPITVESETGYVH